ncbi:helix-turn-helix domain-containing protein [Rahnella woolbedingensis]|uniref:Helix-turn-helix domain-containing protein n=1 Tax=Rahnella woolbedingensis TaxID=1510574 RepID=A0A419N2K2_9GAMM|nr:helix-turn-helix domain-containing protein [Rahnella woolbedingensis]RJT34996.1 helix-turn-helix domain-containing protein [Rahnella woolbedingensis]
MSDTNKYRAFRLERAWSQEQLSELSGLSTRTVQRIENGERPSLETLSALAAVFEVSVSELSAQENAGENALDERITETRNRVAEEGRFYRSIITALVVCILLFMLNHFTSPASDWSLWVAVIWFALIAVRGVRIFLLRGLIGKWQKKRLQYLLRK